MAIDRTIMKQEIQALKNILVEDWTQLASKGDYASFDDFNFTVRHTEPWDDTRWHRIHKVIVEADSTHTFTFEYELGATENQENECDEDTVEPVFLKRVAVTKYEYQTTPINLV